MNMNWWQLELPTFTLSARLNRNENETLVVVRCNDTEGSAISFNLATREWAEIAAKIPSPAPKARRFHAATGTRWYYAVGTGYSVYVKQVKEGPIVQITASDDREIGRASFNLEKGKWSITL